MARVKRMLVPTDFSPASEIALTYALDLAAREGAEVHVLHVLDDVHFATAYPDGMYVEVGGLEARMIDEARKRLTATADRAAAVGIRATTDVVVGKPAPAIAGEAEKRGTDLIVMGTHGRSGLAHLVLGSVAESVLRTAPCPVLTVRDTWRTSEVLAASATARAASLPV
jgi:universal stress protein A